MTKEIMLEGDLSQEFLSYLEARKKALVEVEYEAEFGFNPKKASVTALVLLVLTFAQDVGVEVLATMISDFIAHKIKERKESAQKPAEPEKKELRIVNSEIDFYAANYTRDEIVDILKAVPAKVK